MFVELLGSTKGLVTKLELPSIFNWDIHGSNISPHCCIYQIIIIIIIIIIIKCIKIWGRIYLGVGFRY